jgi:predicted  nucleic acid-binding Zn-ribbon protein
MEAASIDFHPGVNVLCGASETGKSFLVESLDFLLGAGKPLRDIPERVGYDRVRLGLTSESQNEYTLERSVEGGGYLLYEGHINEIAPDGAVPVTLKPKHREDDAENISGWLLTQIGLQGKRLRKNQKGQTISLSFRNLAHLVLIDESSITRQSSPFLTGQYVTKPAEVAALKLLLTGVDDSSLVDSTSSERVDLKHTVKVEVLDEAIFELKNELAQLDVDEKDLRDQLGKIEKGLSEAESQLSALQEGLDGLLNERQSVVETRTKSKVRLREIDELIARFELLRSHYHIDLERLAAVQESGVMLAYQPTENCPLCGTPADQQHKDSDCDGNISAVVAAASAEIRKIQRLLTELEQTVSDIEDERDLLAATIQEIDTKFFGIEQRIRHVSAPTVVEQRVAFSVLVEKREEIQNHLKLYDRMKHLEEMKTIPPDDAREPDADPGSDKTSTTLPKSTLRDFSKRVSKLLEAWNFPSETDVYFDETAVDFVIGGKLRTSEGKGLRAITHAAASIALLEHCRESNLPHPGFVVLDSPLLAYWGPEGEADSLQGCDLKERFYNYLVEHHQHSQIIIIENEHVPAEFENRVNNIVFTKNPIEGRYGLFPPRLGHD